MTKKKRLRKAIKRYTSGHSITWRPEVTTDKLHPQIEKDSVRVQVLYFKKHNPELYATMINQGLSDSDFARVSRAVIA